MVKTCLAVAGAGNGRALDEFAISRLESAPRVPRLSELDYFTGTLINNSSFVMRRNRRSAWLTG